ncbi:tRNA pseudouridine(55) synthase TruB [Cocleimonas sp. KMM 6892]|uniref:tRNA pseudouridine(55) synthase TruB n=1 Tax=unclassified Cocleimonas TaxID=2639732 RepID=UPI002DBD4F4C|nr:MULTISPECIES: tRNA pseudouridine(55) synthase TruB [unclassified Cocleimonas]MEB8433091.1 tRNA pseudouridine(55) synthase TruB [Cocleimonas sp. KMM 6892]MEC4715928.1 tRNA pseudouridine(55) synthase TruB [Cocleimonas sp. KMM 6895]MEC4745389.1 tRNA pseudouridine(55) synthase TruB [Cocleimonas sp. KMM 6896]
MARRKGNDVDGILLLDKPLGRSSNNALQKVRYLFQAKKAGHTGSLDPLATGVLPVCFGQASKVTPYLLDADKSYRCTAQLGVTTTTGDKEGDVLQEREITDFNEQDVEAVLATFRGAIEQVPPMYSALKHNGQPLYKLARQGIDIKRKPRDVTIHELVLIDKTEDSITLDVRCSKGTYIRTLAQDIGEALGFGAHLSMLRRTHVSPFNCDKLYTIEDIEQLAETGKLDEALLPIDTALQELPSLNLSEEETKLLRNGIKVKKADTPDSDMIRLYNQNNTFIGIGRQSKNDNDEIQIAPRRMMNTHEPLSE